MPAVLKEVKKMQQQDINNFLHEYFKATDCSIIESNNNFLHVQLSIEQDKKLMNRPFYWHYIEKMQREPEPLQLRLATDFNYKNKEKHFEAVSLGSPRLQQIFSVTKELGDSIRMYEQINCNKQTPLYPWLCLNVKVSYICDLQKEAFYSIGLQLINGQFQLNFHDYVKQLSLTPKIPDYCFTISPIIMPKSGINRIKQFLTTLINDDDFTWAVEAKERWDKDLQLLNSFYEDDLDNNDSFENEKIALQKQYEPEIIVSIINGGLFFLSSDRLSQLN